jgi:hypothetical protein
LERELRARGQLFEPRCAAEVNEKLKTLRQIDQIDLLIRILYIVRGNGYDRAFVGRQIANTSDRFRAEAFAKIFWPIHDKYRDLLARNNEIDLMT